MPSPRPSPTGLRVPHKLMRALSNPLAPPGRGLGLGEHTAVVVIPFTLCSLLLCNDMTGERARVAQSPPPWRPGLPAENRRFAVPSAYSFRLIGYGRRQRPCKAALSAHPCASPRPSGNASAIYSRTRSSLKALSYSEGSVIASALKSLGNPRPFGERVRVRGATAPPV